MAEIAGLKLPYVKLSINELRYLTNLNSVHFYNHPSKVSKVPPAIPERDEILQIGLMYPHLYDFKRRIGYSISWLTGIVDTVPLMEDFTKECSNRWVMGHSLTGEDIDFVVSKKLLPLKYAGPLKLREGVDDFDRGLGLASRDKSQFDDLVKKTLLEELISPDCSAELSEKGIKAISPHLEEYAYSDGAFIFR